MSDLLLEPAYGKKLKCLAGDCPENCCMEWIIDIDDETAAYYRTVQGESGPSPVARPRRRRKPPLHLTGGMSSMTPASSPAPPARPSP